MKEPRYKRVWVRIKKSKPRRWRRGWRKLPTLGQRALGFGVSLVGVMETGGNNRGPMVDKIIRANGGTGPEPWCGDFVAYCYRQAGSTAVTRSWAAVRFLGYLRGMRVVKHPKPGDIVCFDFDHTGLFVRRDGVGTIVTCEGNTGASGAVSDSVTGGDGVYMKRRRVENVSRYVRVLR